MNYTVVRVGNRFHMNSGMQTAHPNGLLRLTFVYFVNFLGSNWHWISEVDHVDSQTQWENGRENGYSWLRIMKQYVDKCMSVEKKQQFSSGK